MGRFVAPPAPAGVQRGPAPSFSVIVPAYQAAATIDDAVRSVLAQTVPVHEIVVCDDGSTDDLESVLEPYRDAVVLVRQEHRGAAAARNAMLRVATGEFVAPLDADDVFAPTRIARLTELAVERPDLDIVATDAAFVVDGRAAGAFHDRMRFPVERQREAILEACFLIMPAVRRARLLEVGGYDERLATAEDWDCFIRLLYAGATAGLVDEPLLEYRLRSTSLTADRVETLRDRVTVLESVAARGGLSAEEGRALTAALARHRSRALRQAASEALVKAAPDARARLLDVARSRDVGWRPRGRAALAALAPGSMSRFVGRGLAESSGRPVE